MNWILTFSLLFVSCGTLNASVPKVSLSLVSQFTKLLPLNLHGFENCMLTFLNNMILAYDDIASDITNKVTEFQNMAGTQQFMSLGSLYAQYIQLYSIWNLEYTNINTCTNNVLAAGPGTGPALLLYDDHLVTISKSFTMFAKGASLSNTGIIGIINGVEKVVTNSYFSDKNNVLQMLTKYAQDMFDGMITMNDGNQQSILATFSLLGVLNETVPSQTSEATLKFVSHLMDFKTKLNHNLQKISYVEQTTTNKFFNPKTDVGFTVYTTNADDFYTSVNDEQTKIAKYFKVIVKAAKKLSGQISQALAVSSSSST